MMEKQLKVSYSDLTISEFYESHLLNKFNYDPAYQRDSVWSVDRREFLIDSVLKNFPIPPIFLKTNLNSSTGKTVYDVIDGKQRLQSIIGFIEGTVYLPDNFSEGPFGNEDLNGLSFADLQDESDYKKNFWSYKIPIAYIDTESKEAIDGIFDRLNRNGMPLTFQELRNALYQGKALLGTIKELADLDFWKERLEIVKTNRFEHHEFISELFFMHINNSISDSSNTEIDEQYKTWSPKFENTPDLLLSYKEQFEEITDYISSLALDYRNYHFDGVSHIYGIFVFCRHCQSLGIPSEKLIVPLKSLMESYKKRDFNNEALKSYKKSMVAATRQKSQRRARVNSIIDFVNSCNIIDTKIVTIT